MQYKFLDSDPGYTSCSKPTCQVSVAGNCVIETCSGSVSFRMINIRTNLIFVFFSGGLDVPCVVNATAPLSFANPNSPLYGHLSSVDSTGTRVIDLLSLSTESTAGMTLVKVMHPENFGFLGFKKLLDFVNSFLFLPMSNM